MSLRKKAVSGLVWTFAEQFGTQLIGFVVTVLLSRLLLPEDFGVIALFAVVFSLASTILDGGMASSLVRTKQPTDYDYSTVFIYNVIVSIVAYCIIFFTAPLVSNFYNQPELTAIIRVYCISLLIGAFVIIQRTILVKKMDFKTQFKIQLPSLILSGILGVFLAYQSFGVWALVYSALFKSLLSTIQFWLLSSWRPKWYFDVNLFKHHFNFGYKMTLSAILNTIFANIYTIVIGKCFSTIQLGYYNRADVLKQLPVNNLSAALNKVTFPLFVEISHDNIKLKEVYSKLMRVVIFIIAPVLTVMIITAEPLIRFLLTEKWLPIVPYFQILAVSGILYPLHAYNLNVLQVKGRSDLFLKLEVIKKVLIILVVLISINFGMKGLVWGQVISSFLAFFINSHYSGKILKYNSLQQFKDLLPVLFVTFGLGVCLAKLDSLFFYSVIDFVRIIALCLIYAILYLSICFVLKFKEVNYIKEFIKK